MMKTVSHTVNRNHQSLPPLLIFLTFLLFPLSLFICATQKNKLYPHLSLILIFLTLHFHSTSCLSLFSRIRAAAPGMFMSYTMLTPCELLIIGEKHFSALLYTLGASMLALNTCFNLLPVLIIPLYQRQPWGFSLILLSRLLSLLLDF